MIVHSPTRLGGLLVPLLLILSASTLPAQSDDSLRYRIPEADSLREGVFRLQRTDASALLTGGDRTFTVSGTYAAGQPTGDWEFSFGDYTGGGTSEVVDYQYRLNVNGMLHTASGNLTQGQLDGPWVQEVRPITESEPGGVGFRSEIAFAAGVPQGTVQLTGGNDNLLGRFKRDGTAHDSWSYYADLVTQQEWHFRDGLLDSITYVADSVRRVVSVLAGYTGQTRAINLDDRYLNVLATWQDVNGRDGTFTTGGAARLLTDNAGYYRRVGTLLDSLGGTVSDSLFRVYVPDLPLAETEIAQLDSVRTYLRQIDTLASTLSTNAAFAIAETTDPEVGTLKTRLDTLTGEALTPVRTLVAAYEQGVLESVPRQTYLYQLGAGAGPTAEGGLPAVIALTAGVLDDVRAVRAALAERLNTKERRQVITALDEQLMRDFALLDSLVNAQEEDFQEAYGLDNLRSTAREALQQYATFDDPVRKQDRARELIQCVEELDALAITVAKLPQRSEEIEDLYTDEVWNNFTATVMEERVQRRVFEAYETLLPYFRRQLRSPLDCQRAGRLHARLNALHTRMRELRGQDTDALEDQLRRTDDPARLLDLLGVTLQQ